MTESTILRLAGVGVPPYSARGLQQTLQPVDGATSLRRTINGALRNLSDVQFQKYASSISGSDVAPPAVDGVWPGKSIVVDCIPELAVLDANPTATSEATTEELATLGRTPVPGTVRRADGFLYYRPRLTFLVVSLTTNADEWQAGVQWTLNLEEV